MNINRNPTKEELQALFEACNGGSGIHVLWAERLGKAQITLLFTETDVEWLKEESDKVQFHHASFTKNDGYDVEEKASVDELYISTLFERLSRDWNNNKSGPIDNPIVSDQKTQPQKHHKQLV